MSEHINEHCSESPNAETRALFSCKICFEPYSKCYRCPVSLNCGHTFCLVCIRKLGMNKSTIQCGICRKNTYANYKRLGKNIVLTELLEWMNILVNDSDRKPTPEEEAPDEQQPENEWPGAQHFIGPANLEDFYEELQTFDALVHNWPSYSSFQRQLDRRVQNLRCDMSAVEAQLRQAGDTFKDILAKMEELRTDLNNQMTAYQIEQQEGPDILTFRDQDNGWDNFGDLGGWSRGGGGLASPPPVVLPMPISDDSDRESTNQRVRRRNNLGWNYNNNNNNRRYRQRPQYQVLVLSEHPISCHPLPPPLPGDDWGSSSGWSDNENDKENDKTSNSEETTEQQDGGTENEKQKTEVINEPKPNNTETVKNQEKYQEEPQQSTSNYNSNNFRQQTPRVHRTNLHWKNWDNNSRKNNNQHFSGLNQSNGTTEFIYYTQNRNVEIKQKY